VLFDLQTPRRRRVVRVVFGGLALIFAISFVFLGVGTGGGGFSFSDLFGGGGGSNSNSFDGDIKAAQEKLAINPNDASALASLVSFQYQAGRLDADSNGNLNSDGEQHMRESVDAWNRYLKATGGKPSRGPALFATQASLALARIDFNGVGQAASGTDQLTSLQSVVDDLATAGDAQLALAKQHPTAANYTNAAQFYYQAGKNQQGDAALAQAKALSKGNAASKLDSQMAQLKALGAKFTAAIKQLEKQQQKTQGAGGGNPLGGISGGGGSVGGVGTGGL
jgi:hypothetical protein